MARKSRKAEEMQSKTLQTVKAKYRAAVYARLSSEKEETLERGTIDNQVDFVRDYVNKQEDMEIYDIYVDDSFTGTNFERPGFTRMMADMRAGRINTIVVKDLSRLGRDYLETGNLIERVFPMYELRFIAVLDGYDSSKSSVELMIPVTNIANALYAVDISKKISSSMKERRNKGVPAGRVPYGYKVVFDEKHVRCMVPDAEMAKVVRRIFDYYLNGVNPANIAEILNTEMIPTPYQYISRNRKEKLEKKQHLKWNSNQVNKVLNNDVYTGRYVLGKHRQCLYNHEKNHATDKEEWVVFENHHEAIVSPEEFKRVKETRPKVDFSNKGKNDNLFKGRMACGKCGSSMGFHKGKYYICSRKDKYGKSTCDCNDMGKEIVEATVFHVLKEEMQLLIEQDAAIKSLSRTTHIQEKKLLFKDAVNKGLRESERLKERKSGLYRDLMDGLLTEEEYLELNKDYTEQLEDISEKMKEYTEMLQRMDSDPLEEGNVKELIEKYIKKRKLSQEMVSALVEKVIVRENKSLEVVLKFEDVKEKMLKKRAEMEGKL